MMNLNEHFISLNFAPYRIFSHRTWIVRRTLAPVSNSYRRKTPTAIAVSAHFICFGRTNRCCTLIIGISGRMTWFEDEEASTFTSKLMIKSKTMTPCMHKRRTQSCSLFVMLMSLWIGNSQKWVSWRNDAKLTEIVYDHLAACIWFAVYECAIVFSIFWGTVRPAAPALSLSREHVRVYVCVCESLNTIRSQFTRSVHINSNKSVYFAHLPTIIVLCVHRRCA